MGNQSKAQKQLAFLEETAAFYNSNNRCVEYGLSCKYFIDGKAGCAIGRHIKDKELCKALDAKSIHSGVNTDDVYLSLPVELQELDKDFLVKIQELHDLEENWDENGLSKGGKRYMNYIKKKFNLYGQS